MITANVYNRVFYLHYKDSKGTCFTVDINMRQYLVTARHVVSDIADGDEVRIFYKRDWHTGKVRVVGLGIRDDIGDDVAVLSMEHRLSPALSLEATPEGLVFGQNVYFLGFPFGLYVDTDVMRGFPAPLVKKGVVSGSIRAAVNRPDVFLLDGHNNPGFSGGPVVFRPGERTAAEYKVLGVVSGYRLDEGDVFLDGRPTGLKHKENTGIILAPSIKRVTEMIEANPIGLPIDQPTT